jgi:hypothetical protein
VGIADYDSWQLKGRESINEGMNVGQMLIKWDDIDKRVQSRS